MHYIVHVRLRGFYVGNVQGRAKGEGLAITRDRAVLDCDASAAQRGVRIGMSVSEAKMLLREGTFLAWTAGDYAAGQEAWLDMAARYSGTLEPFDQHTAFLDLTGHPDPLLIALRATDALRALGYGVLWGMAQVKWLARLGSLLNAKEAPLRDPARFLWPLPPQRLPISAEAQERLLMLGYTTIGEVASLGVETLREQFGRESLCIQQAAWGGWHEPVRGLYPQSALTDRVYFEGPVEDRLALDRSLKQMSKRLGHALRERDSVGSDVVVDLDTEEDVRSLKRRFAKPIDGPDAVYTALTLLTDKVCEPVLGIRATLPRLTQADKVQQALDGPRPDRQTGIETAFRQLREVFGEEAIKRASDIEIKRRDLVMKAWRDATGWR
jgi:DNA polymerase-4